MKRSAGISTQVLKPKVPVRRIVFHEITEDAVKEALEHPGQVNEDLVRAQESRRILDRLYGYTLSPLLWKKVQTGLSAGRVQSVAVRLIVEREEERRAFRTAVYWDLEAKLKGEGREFVATLARINDQRIATGKDFDAKTGELKNQNVASARRSGRRHARRRDSRERPVDDHQRRAEAGRRTPGAAVHHVNADAGSQPQAGIFDRAHDAVGAAAVPGRRNRQRRDGRSHHLSPHRLDDAVGQGNPGIGARDSRDVRRPSITTRRGATRRGSRTRRKRTKRFARPISVSRRASSNAFSTATI